MERCWKASLLLKCGQEAWSTIMLMMVLLMLMINHVVGDDNGGVDDVLDYIYILYFNDDEEDREADHFWRQFSTNILSKRWILYITGVQGVDKHPGVLYQPCLRLQASSLFIKIASEGSIDRNMMLIDPPGMMLLFLRRTSWLAWVRFSGFHLYSHVVHCTLSYISLALCIAVLYLSGCENIE